MAKTDRRKNRARRAPTTNHQLPSYVIVIGFVLVAGLGYIAGAFNGHLFNRDISVLWGGDTLDLSSVQETYQALKSNYDGELDEAALIEGASKGLVEAVGDAYTVFMNADQTSQFDDSLTGNIGGGIGVELGLRDDVPTVIRVLEDNPAQAAGVQVGDVVAAVNGEDSLDWSVSEVVDKVRGEAGTTVKLTVLRGGAEQDISVTRAIVSNPSVYGEVVDGIGRMTISRFDSNTGSLARSIAREFNDKNVTGVVVDLRGNGGGYVTAAQDVAGIWLDNKVVVEERSGGRVTEELKSGKDPILAGVPTVVLVNESSASASEIVAGALRDHGAATLVGETTFGKGSVQKLVDLSQGATLKVTIARWYTPAGVNISETGIKPSVEVIRTADDINAGRDPQLEAALGVLAG